MPKGKKYGGLQAAPPRFKNCANCGQQMSDCLVSKAGRHYRLRTAAWEARRFCCHACRILPSQKPQFKHCIACGIRYSNVRKHNTQGSRTGLVSPEKWALSQWCSTNCRWVTQAAVLREKNCLECGKVFNNMLTTGIKAGSIVDSQRFLEQRFCSNPCGLRYRQHRTTLQAFEQNIGKKRKNGCIHWLGHRTSFGHGRIELKDIGNRGILAHRLAYALFKGPVPGDRIVCHDCNNPPCVNPDHLYLGDYRTNSADRFGRKRPAAAAIKNRHPDVFVDDSGKLWMRRISDR